MANHSLCKRRDDDDDDDCLFPSTDRPITLLVAKCWDPSPKNYFTIPRQEPVCPIDPRAWVLHTNAMTAAALGASSQTAPGGPPQNGGMSIPPPPPGASAATAGGFGMMQAGRQHRCSQQLLLGNLVASVSSSVDVTSSVQVKEKVGYG